MNIKGTGCLLSPRAQRVQRNLKEIEKMMTEANGGVKELEFPKTPILPGTLHSVESTSSHKYRAPKQESQRKIPAHVPTGSDEATLDCFA